jgi:hypothetical protein
MRLGIAEIFQKVEAADTKDDKIAVLRKNGTDIHNTTLFLFLRFMFEAEAEWHPDLPKGKLKYSPCQFFDQQPALYQKIKLFPRLFFVRSPLDLPKEKRQLLYVQMLEALDKDDAALVEALRTKKPLYKSITRALVDEAFPGLVQDEPA